MAGDGDPQRLLARRSRADVGHRLVQTDQPERAFRKPCRLPERHAERCEKGAGSGLTEPDICLTIGDEHKACNPCPRQVLSPMGSDWTTPCAPK
jgi:hypothetical protein